MSSRAHIAIIIPALRPQDSLLALLGSLGQAQFGRVIVVDDGSGPEYSDVFAAARERYGCDVLVHPVNRGKGAALKTAFDHALSTMPEITDFVTCDADGQHTPEDIIEVADRLAANRDAAKTAVVWGARDFSRPGIPWKSRFGNRSMSVIVKLVFGRWIGDTQTGLRGFPRETLRPLLDVPGERFEYEMNVLIWALEDEVEIETVPIRTVYLDSSNSHSHFHPVRDSLHILVRLARFASSSLIGAALDLALYAILIETLFGGQPSGREMVLCAVAARVVSSLVNFTINRDWVFRSHASWIVAVVRYYLLVIVLLGLSAAGSVALSAVLGGYAVLAKAIVDSLLFVASYEVQRTWVFTRSREGGA